MSTDGLRAPSQGARTASVSRGRAARIATAEGSGSISAETLANEPAHRPAAGGPQAGDGNCFPAKEREAPENHRLPPLPSTTR
jgi:hypothetical protein